jgi:three-Cys-motif partner protein
MSMGSGLQNLRVDDDRLATPEVGGWAETKYRLLALYDELFSTGMKNKWDQRVYIDLYAGAGYSQIQGTSRFLKGSPVIALTVTHPFDKYIFCEESEVLLNALRTRVKSLAPQADVTCILGNCDAEIEQICRQIPKASPTNRVLSLCLVDPFDFGLKFATLSRLSAVFMDFVVLLAIGMDANRNYEHYVKGNSPKIDEALGNVEWRERWRSGRRKKKRLQAVSCVGVFAEHGIAQVHPAAPAPHEGSQVTGEEPATLLPCPVLTARHRVQILGSGAQVQY